MKRFMWPYWRMHVWTFFNVLGLYFIVSVMLFAETSGGWSAMLELFGGFAIGGILYVISYSTASSLASSSRGTLLRIDLRILCLLLISQGAAMLFNVGDNGDGPGNYTFLEKMLHGGDVSNLHSQFAGLMWMLLLLYLALLVVFLVASFSQAEEQ